MPKQASYTSFCLACQAVQMILSCTVQASQIVSIRSSGLQLPSEYNRWRTLPQDKISACHLCHLCCWQRQGQRHVGDESTARFKAYFSTRFSEGPKQSRNMLWHHSLHTITFSIVFVSISTLITFAGHSVKFETAQHPMESSLYCGR